VTYRECCRRTSAWRRIRDRILGPRTALASSAVDELPEPLNQLAEGGPGIITAPSLQAGPLGLRAEELSEPLPSAWKEAGITRRPALQNVQDSLHVAPHPA
jgi:hypothetical protein